MARSAAIAAGGTIIPLGASTRGLICVNPRDPVGLAMALRDHPRIGWVQFWWSGIDAFLPVIAESSKLRSIVWTSAKGAYSGPVAEHALALVLACLRRLSEKARSPRWESVRTGETLSGRRVLIVGAGGVAREFIRLVEPFGAEIVVVRRDLAPVAGAAETLPIDRLDDALRTADVVVLAAAVTASTRGMLDDRRLSLMRARAVLVNVGRGELIDTDALVRALGAGRLLGVGLDVTDPEPLPEDHPLRGFARVLVTSHAANTDELQAPLIAQRIGTNVRAFLARGGLDGIIDPTAGY